MSKIISISFLLANLLMAEALCADIISIVNEKEPAVIPMSQTREFQFGTVPQANTTVLLKIKSRMDTSALLGSMRFLRLTLNGREVQPSKTRTTSRLVNKPLISPVAPDLAYKWYDDAGGWNVLYAPDFRSAYTQEHYVGDPYLYVLDVTDLTNPLAENRLKIGNTATPAFVQQHAEGGFQSGPKRLDLVVGSVEIETKPGASPTMVAAPEMVATVINRGEPGAGPARYRGELSEGGGFVMRLGKSTYRFNSSFSFPDAGFNRLTAGAPATGGQKGWVVSSKGNRATGEGPDYAVARTVTFGPTCVKISDAITNRRKDAPLGLSVRHELDLSALKNAPIRLAGNPDPTLSEHSSLGNPSVHIVTPEGGMGMIAEDDVFRNQVLLYVRSDETARTPVAGLRTEMLRLAPGETYTLQWAVYPVAGPDYYDFVNLVRDNWGANFAVLGPYRWGLRQVDTMSVEEIRALIKRQGIRYFIDFDTVEWKPSKRGTQRIAMGTDVFSDYWAESRQKSLDTIKKLRMASPDIKILGYYNSMRETDDNTLTRFADSLMIDANGKFIKTMWTPSPGATNPSYTMVPTLKNSFGKAMLETARRYMDDMTLDGLYWDENEGIAFGQIMITYNNFDGHSCLIDQKTWRIEREVGIGTLASRSFYDEVFRIIQKKGGLMFCNGPSGSRNTLRDHMQRMVESQHNDYYAFEASLQSPLGYYSWTDSWEDFLRNFRMALLPVDGCRTELPHEISPYLFPFTAIELHPGYLLGKERIVATHSGNYGWSAQRALARVRHFGDTGKLTTTDFPTTLGSEARTVVTLQAKEAIVLERLPLSFEPEKNEPAAKRSTWSAEVRQMRYDPDVISLQLSAPQGGVLKIEDGEFSLHDGTTLTVRLGTESQSIEVKNRILRIVVPAGFSGAIAIERKGA